MKPGLWEIDHLSIMDVMDFPFGISHVYAYFELLTFQIIVLIDLGKLNNVHRSLSITMFY